MEEKEINSYGSVNKLVGLTFLIQQPQSDTET